MCRSDSGAAKQKQQFSQVHENAGFSAGKDQRHMTTSKLGSSLIAVFAVFACAAHADLRKATSLAAVTVTTPSAPGSGAAMDPATLPPQSLQESRLETLGQGDMVRITVFRNPDLTTEARISERGTILFPMIGEVAIVGLTPSQAGSRIADKLRSGRYVVNPEVNVSLAQVNSRQVSVLGAVNKPGRYPLDSQNVRLSDLLAT